MLAMALLSTATVTVAAAFATTAAVLVTAEPASAAPSGASAYVAVAPTRVFDTRTGLGGSSRVPAGGLINLTIAGQAPVPTGAIAVVVNLTVTNVGRDGFITAWPAGQPQPLTSVINFEHPGQTIANLVTVSLGADGAISLFALGDTDLIADVQGYYITAAASTSGRFLPTAPTRVIDTRLANPVRSTPLGVGDTVEIDLRPFGIAADATAAVLNVTITEAAAPGFWTVYPVGARPEVSNLNIDAVGQTRPNQVIATLTGGRFTVFAQTGGHLVIDLVGSFSGVSAPSSDVGLFIPVAPTRLVDTRDVNNGPGVAVRANQKVEVLVANRAGIPPTGVAGVVVNATVTEAAGAGYFTVWPARTYRPTVSSLNATAVGQTTANHVITPVSDGGFNFYTQIGAHLIADVTGWFTGAPTPSVLPVAVPIPGPFGPAEVGGYIYRSALAGNTLGTNVAGPEWSPIRWNSCRPIRYLVNLNGYPAQYRQVIEEAVERIGTATGMQFAPVGDTAFMPTNTDPWALTRSQRVGRNGPHDLIIALGSEAVTDLVPGFVGGVAVTDTVVSSRAGAITASSVVIDMGDTARTLDWASGGTGTTLLHELAHAVGLGHVPDSSQVMFPSTSPGVATYGGGDLRGLWQVGAVRGCIAL